MILSFQCRTLLFPLAYLCTSVRNVQYMYNCMMHVRSETASSVTRSLVLVLWFMSICRWDVERYGARMHTTLGGHVVQFGSFIQAADTFDPAAFALSPSEALLMDPQHRLLLDCGAQVMKSSTVSASGTIGIKNGVPGNTSSPASPQTLQQWGVFIGTSSADYGRLISSLNIGVTAYNATAGTLSVASGRLSYTFGLRGPAVTVDTACSSSLVATHSAVNAVQLQQCRGALVGGVNLTLIPDTPIMFQKAGRCHEGVIGYVR